MAPRKTTAFYKVNDFYARHNIGTRVALFVFLLAYIYTIILSSESVHDNIDINNSSNIKDVYQYIKNDTRLDLVKITGYFAIGMAALITLGDNALSKIADIITAIRK